MSQQHTQEPWITHNGGVYSAKAKDEKLYAEMSVAACHTPEDARRIVACVNACSGSPTDALEEMQRRGLTFGQLAFLHARLQQQRDTLLSALEELNSVSARGFLYDDPARVKARAAIASVKEQA